MKLNKTIGAIITIIFIILMILLVIQIILNLTNHSPSDIQILYLGMSVIISYLLAMSYKMGSFVGEVKEFMNTTKLELEKTKSKK